MTLGYWSGRTLRIVTTLWAAALLALAPQAAFAQDAAADASGAAEAVAEPAALDATSLDATSAETPAYTPLGPEWIKGQPELGGFDFQKQYTDDGQYAYNMHTYLLIPVITVISLFVLALLLWVVVRYRRRVNPEPSKTTHNTFIEVVWTVVPALILVVIAYPSITLLRAQYETPPADAVTIKATGYQWYWGYTYPDNGGFEVISNMLSDEDALARGEPAKLAVDNRMVVPANTPIRLQTTAADVIHAFAVPALWFKMDAIPGRLNERMLEINEPGIYYGQCSELCGIKHAYMPITVEALPRDKWEAWVATQGGTVGGAEQAPAAAAPAAPAPVAPVPAAAVAE